MLSVTAGRIPSPRGVLRLTGEAASLRLPLTGATSACSTLMVFIMDRLAGGKFGSEVMAV